MRLWRAQHRQTSSGVPRHENQMAWARFYLVLAGLLDSSKRGIWTLTERGRNAPSLTPAQALDLFREVRTDMAAERSAGIPARVPC